MNALVNEELLSGVRRGESHQALDLRATGVGAIFVANDDNLLELLLRCAALHLIRPTYCRRHSVRLHRLLSRLLS